MGASLTTNIAAFEQLDSELERAERIGQNAAVKRGGRAAGNAVLQRLNQNLPKPGYPGDSDETQSLRDHTGVRVLSYQDGRFVVVIVGAKVEAGGQHFHLVELGHDIVVGGTSPKPGTGRKTLRKAASGFRGTGHVAGRVAGRFYLAQAAEATKAAQKDAIDGGFREAFEEKGGVPSQI